MKIEPVGSTLAGVTHHQVSLNGTELHYVEAGHTGSPILLVHGFPETWWTFHKVIPRLAQHHRVFAVDLRGFGDSDPASDREDSSTAAEDLSCLIAHIGMGPVHLVGQDISGATVLRLATAHPEHVASLTAIEMGLPGFGLEALADVTRGGAWHIGVLAASGAPELLLGGREKQFLETFMFQPMCASPDAVANEDLDEFARSYAHSNGWTGAAALYRSMLREGPEIRAMVEAKALTLPILAVGAGGGAFTVETMKQVTAHPITSVLLEGVGHYAAMEDPERVADAILAFVAEVDATQSADVS